MSIFIVEVADVVDVRLIATIFDMMYNGDDAQLPV